MAYKKDIIINNFLGEDTGMTIVWGGEIDADSTDTFWFD
jgi:hypothetical protein